MVLEKHGKINILSKRPKEQYAAAIQLSYCRVAPQSLNIKCFAKTYLWIPWLISIPQISYSHIPPRKQNETIPESRWDEPVFSERSLSHPLHWLRNAVKPEHDPVKPTPCLLKNHNNGCPFWGSFKLNL